MITEDDVVCYTEGDCHFLAREIHNLTGWQFASFWMKDIQEADIHAFVVTPSGMAVDVEGFHNMKQFKRRWKVKDICFISPEDLFDEWGQSSLFHRDDIDTVSRANEIAKYLIGG